MSVSFDINECPLCEKQTKHKENTVRGLPDMIMVTCSDENCGHQMLCSLEKYREYISRHAYAEKTKTRGNLFV